MPWEASAARMARVQVRPHAADRARLGGDAVEGVSGHDGAQDYHRARDRGAAEDLRGPEVVVAPAHAVVDLAGDGAVDDGLGEQRRRDPDHVADGEEAGEGGGERDDQPEQIVAAEVETP